MRKQSSCIVSQISAIINVFRAYANKYSVNAKKLFLTCLIKAFTGR